VLGVHLAAASRIEQRVGAGAAVPLASGRLSSMARYSHGEDGNDRERVRGALDRAPVPA